MCLSPLSMASMLLRAFRLTLSPEPCHPRESQLRRASQRLEHSHGLAALHHPVRLLASDPPNPVRDALTLVSCPRVWAALGPAPLRARPA